MANITEVEVQQKKLEQTLERRFAEFEEWLQAAAGTSNTTPSLESQYEEFRTFRDTVSGMLSVIRMQIQACANVVDDIDMRQRRKVLLFHGITDNEDTCEEHAVLCIINKTMGLSEVTKSSIKRCHRLGPFDESNPKPVLVHFAEHHIKSSVWKLKSKLKGIPVTVAEFLTRTRQAIHKSACKHFGLRNVWTHDGTIFIKPPSGSRVKIVTEAEYEALVAKFPSNNDVVSMEGSSQQSSSSSNRSERRKPTSAATSDDSKRTRRAASKK